MAKPDIGAQALPVAGAGPGAPGTRLAALRRADARLARLESFVCTLIVLGMVVLAFLQAVLRNAFDTGFDWADSVLKFLTLWVALLGASIATFEGKHISIDVMTRIVPKAIARAMRIYAGITAAMVCAIFAWACLRYIRHVDQMNDEVVVAGIPKWWFQSILPVSFGIMALRFSLRGLLEIFRQPVPYGDVPASTAELDGVTGEDYASGHAPASEPCESPVECSPAASATPSVASSDGLSKKRGKNKKKGKR